MPKRPDGVNRSKFKVRLSGMPALSHWPGKQVGAVFDIQKSEVVAWLKGSDEAMQFLFDLAGHTGMIVYSSETGTWAGVDTDFGKQVLAGQSLIKKWE